MTVRTYARTSVRPSAQTLREGEGRQPDEGEENAIFSWREIARCFWATGVFLGGKSHDHRRFWKRSFFSKTIVREHWSTWQKKNLISINGKKKFKRILVEGEKFKLQKLPSKDFIAFVLKHKRVSEVVKGSKVNDFEYYGQRNYVLKWEFNLCH